MRTLAAIDPAAPIGMWGYSGVALADGPDLSGRPIRRETGGNYPLSSVLHGLVRSRGEETLLVSHWSPDLSSDNVIDS